MNIVTVSSKNQITLPKSILSFMGIRPSEKLMIEYKDEELILKPLSISIIDQVAGSLTSHVSSYKFKKSFNQILTETRKKVSRKLVKKS